MKIITSSGAMSFRAVSVSEWSPWRNDISAFGSQLWLPGDRYKTVLKKLSI